MSVVECVMIFYIMMIIGAHPIYNHEIATYNMVAYMSLSTYLTSFYSLTLLIVFEIFISNLASVNNCLFGWPRKVRGKWKVKKIDVFFL